MKHEQTAIKTSKNIACVLVREYYLEKTFIETVKDACFVLSCTACDSPRKHQVKELLKNPQVHSYHLQCLISSRIKMFAYASTRNRNSIHRRTESNIRLPSSCPLMRHISMKGITYTNSFGTYCFSIKRVLKKFNVKHFSNTFSNLLKYPTITPHKNLSCKKFKPRYKKSSVYCIDTSGLKIRNRN